MASGLWCGQGVAAAVGALRGLPPDTIAHAVAIAGTVAPALAPVGNTRFMGNHVKEGIPAATANGMIAAELAQAGFTGPLDLLDDPSYDPAVLREGLGERWMIEGVYFKPYSCCRWAHAAVEAALGLQARHGFAADDIVRLDIATFGRALSLNNEIAPRSLESAQYSVPFCVALALLRGPDALLPMLDAALADAEAIGLAGRIALAVDPALDAMFSAAVPARVTVATRTGRFTTTVTAPRGEPANPMSWDDLARKARVATRALADRGFADHAVASVRSLGEGRLEPLLGVLRTRFDEVAASAAC